ARNVGKAADRARRAAFLGKFLAEIGDRRIGPAAAEIEQDAETTEIALILRRQSGDRRESAVLKRAGPEIVRAHLHAPLILADRGGRRIARDVVIAVVGA